MYEVESTRISSINNRVYANQTKRNDKCRHSGLLDKCEITARKFWKFLDVVESRMCNIGQKELEKREAKEQKKKKKIQLKNDNENKNDNKNKTDDS